MRRLLFLLSLLAAVAAPAASAQSEEPPPPPPPPPVIAEGVTIGGVPVGGMTGAEARAAVQAAFDQRLQFRWKARRWQLAPAKLGSHPYLRDAAVAALAAPAGTKVKLNVRVRPRKVKAYTAYLQRVFGRQAKDSRILIRGARPFVTKAKFGRKVQRKQARLAITRALVRMDRTPIAIKMRRVAPRVTRGNVGPIVLVKRESRRLQLWYGMRLVRTFPIAVGTASYPTPLGTHRVVSKVRHPTWNPPSSPWAAGLGPVPPGPANPLGTRWIGTSAPGIGIHGTPAPWTVGTAASHGCIRMYMGDVEWLFERVRIGTPVYLLRA